MHVAVNCLNLEISTVQDEDKRSQDRNQHNPTVQSEALLQAVDGVDRVAETWSSVDDSVSFRKNVVFIGRGER